MEKNEIKKLVDLRSKLITEFSRLRDYKNNPNAIMKEVDFARSLHFTIQNIDELLKEHVNFSDKK
jgi:hypothetical protein